MKSICIKNACKSYGGEPIIQDLNLTVPQGSFFALLGPSGSGKTTLLRLIAGFETLDKGSIFLGEEDITQLSAYKRKINTVFQQYALFPHMNVFDNVAYGLRIKGIAPDLLEEKVQNILSVVHLEKYRFKSVSQLSGGQQQRIALARAVINEPEVLLLDEPLAALDLKLRERMLLELIELQDTLKTTFIYVTHDQLEALTVADYMAIMDHDGTIQQVGNPKHIYENPRNSFVASFVGTTNLFQGTLRIGEAGNFLFQIADLGLFEVSQCHDSPWASNGAFAVMSLRPEKIEISKIPLFNFSNMIEGFVRSIVYHGRSTQYNVQLINEMIVSVFEQNEDHFPQETIDYDDRVYLYWQKENVVILEF
jgi:spermidine/putrescine transport system ATP-binding protein